MSTSGDSKGPEDPRASQKEKFGRIVQRTHTMIPAQRGAAEAELEKELANEKDGRREDRFLFAVTLIVIFDIWAMRDVDTWTVPVVVGVIELFFLLIFARRMGVEEIHFWLNQLLPHFKVGFRKPDEPETPASPPSRPAPETDQKQPDKSQ